MKGKLKWVAACLLLAAALAITLFKPPQAISQMLAMIAAKLAPYSLIMHGAFLVAVAVGLLWAGARSRIFAGLAAMLAASAATVALVFLVIPNIAVFVLYFALILQAILADRLRWELSEVRAFDWLFGIIGLVFGFWYLHWVESPVMLNALLYSPLGVLNCPTMLAISGLLCLASQRSALLEFTSGVVCVYFGIFGIFLLGAYVDAALVLCGSYQLARLMGSARRSASMVPGRLGTA